MWCDTNLDSKTHSWQANLWLHFLDKSKYDLRTFLILDFPQPLLMWCPGIEAEVICHHWLNKQKSSWRISRNYQIIISFICQKGILQLPTILSHNSVSKLCQTTHCQLLGPCGLGHLLSVQWDQFHLFLCKCFLCCLPLEPSEPQKKMLNNILASPSRLNCSSTLHSFLEQAPFSAITLDVRSEISNDFERKWFLWMCSEILIN